VESAVASYVRAAGEFLDPSGCATGSVDELFNAARLELALTDEQERASRQALACAGVLSAADAASTGAASSAPAPFVILNPGANNPAKRWPAERFAAIGSHVARLHGWRVLVNGSPAERELVDLVARLINDATTAHAPASSPFPAPATAVSLIDCGISMGALKGVVRHARLMVTNDTGPRHIAAAFGVPTLTLFGPTDPRWTTLPPHNARSAINLVADPTLPERLVADDHPERCAIEKIGLERAIEATGSLIDLAGTPRAS
jgi:heptosyltransferase-2